MVQHEDDRTKTGYTLLGLFDYDSAQCPHVTHGLGLGR